MADILGLEYKWQELNKDHQTISDLGEYIYEECQELQWAVDNDEPDEEKLKEMTDVLFTIVQYCMREGWDLTGAYDATVISNMSKVWDGHLVRNDKGKIQKGPNYKAPDMTPYLTKDSGVNK